MTLKAMLSPIVQPRRWLRHLLEPQILFPTAAILVLGVIWATTLNLIKVEHAAAVDTAATSSRELAETYEAQVIRALREIDLTLKVVKYAYESRAGRPALDELKTRSLLLPDLLFEISIVDSKGNVVASTNPSLKANIAGKDYFKNQRNTDTLIVGRPQQNPDSGDWKLYFSRRLDNVDGSFAGAVVIAVDSAYFVSGYETAKLGEHGVLGLLGTDGIFRVRRGGEEIIANDPANYSALLPAIDDAEKSVTLVASPWDGVRRYTSVHTLYGFPLAVIVGLSQKEQLAESRSNMYSYLGRATATSILLIIIVMLLSRMSRQLALSRKRAVDEQIAHAAQVEYLAYHDGLTTLPNRSLFSKLLSDSINQAHRYGRRLGVLFLDLDRFKQINDTLGHDAGDELLREVAKRLKACLRESDTAARLGGDEFVVVLPELDDEKYCSTVAQKILTAVARPYAFAGQEFRITASIGISTYPLDGLDEQTLTKNADIAMYQAKQDGKNIFRFYSEDLNAYSLERLTLESGLRQALEQEEFMLHYQPKLDIHSGLITGMEALLRWQHPALGTVAPMKFIPVAEETGLILPIGKWVLHTACAQNVAWQKEGLPRLSISVNLTARQFFDENLLAYLISALAETGMDADMLELEVAEGLLMRDVEKTMKILTGLKNLGVMIAIDDFGIGYASLSMLKQFPLDTIKIDRSFISDVTRDAENKALTEAIIAMGRALSLTVVAQGVETKAQADFLRQKSCDEFQGFYFNRPVSAEEVGELLRGQPGLQR